MKRTPKGIYTHEFHAEAVKLVKTTDLSVMRAAKHLSIPQSSLDNWVRTARESKLAEVGQEQRVPSAPELELVRTRKKLADVKMERDLLKKFATYFAKEPR